MLVAGVVALINSIPLSIRTMYGYSRLSLGISPRGDIELTPKLYQPPVDGPLLPDTFGVHLEGKVSAQQLDVRKSWRAIRRHRLIVAAAAAVGLPDSYAGELTSFRELRSY